MHVELKDVESKYDKLEREMLREYFDMLILIKSIIGFIGI